MKKMKHMPSRATPIGLVLGLAMSAGAGGADLSLNLSGFARTFDDPQEFASALPTSAGMPISAFETAFSGDEFSGARLVMAAAASSGSLAADIDARAFGPFDDFGVSGIADMEASGTAIAGAIIDDLVFSGPTATVTGNLLLDVSGSLFTQLLPITNDVFITANTQVTVTARMAAGGIDGSGNQTISATQESGMPEQVLFFDSGALDGAVLPDTIDFGSFTVPVDTPVTLELALVVMTGVSLDTTSPGGALEDGYVRGRGAFGTTVSFPTAGPAFVLNPGFSVNSVAAEIVDNAWLGTPVSASAVPLPAAAWLLLGALATLGPAANRKRRA